jgi:1,4-alpha-glucan branching enzyme
MTRDEVERLVRGEHHEPHRLLGVHIEDGRVVVRAFRPEATAVTALIPEGSGEPQGGAPVGREGSGEPQGGAPVGREGSGEPQGGAPVDREEPRRGVLPGRGRSGHARGGGGGRGGRWGWAGMGTAVGCGARATRAGPHAGA